MCFFHMLSAFKNVFEDFFFFFLLAAVYGSITMIAYVCSAGPIFKIRLVSDFMDVRNVS